LEPSLLAYRYSMQAGEQGFEIRCQLQADNGTSSALLTRTPHRIATTLTSRFGIQRIEAQLGNDVILRAELIDPLVSLRISDNFHDHQKSPVSLKATALE